MLKMLPLKYLSRRQCPSKQIVTTKRKKDPLLSEWKEYILYIYFKSWIQSFKNLNKGELNKNVLP